MNVFTYIPDTFRVGRVSDCRGNAWSPPFFAAGGRDCCLHQPGTRSSSSPSVAQAQAEVLAILEDIVKPQGRLKLGSLLVEIGRDAHLTDELVDLINDRDRAAPREIDFE